jgi:chromatin remodeling complex protein RSC6
LAAKKKTITKKKPITKKKVTSSSSKQTKSTTKTKKPAFGGYAIDFSGRTETVEQVFGKKPVAPSEMTKKIWVFIKSNNLSNR